MAREVDDNVVAPLTVRVPAKDTESFKVRVTDEPKETSPPPVKLVPGEIVTLEFDKAELAILDRVFDDPEMVLLVKV